MAECPFCHASPAYVSLSIVECSNKQCSKYSKEAYPDPPAPVEDDEDDVQKPQYLWRMYHSDCGD